MKKIILILLLTAFNVSAMAKKPVDLETKEINTLLDSWHKAAATADEKTYFGLMAEGAIFLGTDETEKWTKEEFEKWSDPYFKKESAWIFTPIKREVYISKIGNVAWFEETLDSKSYWISRGSGVLEKINGKWKIRHYNLALTIPNESVKEIKPIIDKTFNKQNEIKKHNN